MPGSPLLSFLIPTRGRPRELRACLESLARAGAEGRAEAWVGFDGGGPEAEALAAELAARYPWVRTEVLERCGRGEARNLLAARAAGELVWFLDDDTTVPAGFIEAALAAFGRHPRAPVVGGPNVGPADASPFQRAVDFLLRSPLGAGPMRVRYRRAGEERALPGWCFMLSNFGARRSLFEKGFRFPSRCHSAEENLFLHEVERGAGRPVFSPGLYVRHQRRPTLGSFLSQVFTNGRGRAQITLAAPSSLQLAVLAPLAGLLLLAAFGPAPLALYLAAAAFEGLRLAVQEGDLRAAVRLPILFPLAHLAYAAGLAAGVFSGRPVHAGAAAGHPRGVRPARVGLARDA